MGKSGDKNDKTQLLSDSQVLEVKPSRPKHARPTPTHARKSSPPGSPPGADKNDRSVWKGLVVGADEFAPPSPPPRSRTRWIAVGILGAAAVGGGAYFLWPKSSAPPTPDAAATKQPDAAEPTPDARPDARPIDAAVDAVADAAVDAAPRDAGTVDAGVDAGVKPHVKKKGVIKKRPVKRKVGPATSR